MTLIDRYVPNPHYHERHTLRVPAPAAAVLSAAAEFRPENDAFFRRMIALREAPMRLAGAFGVGGGRTIARFGIDDFTLLARNDGEIVFGLIGSFWRSDYGLTRFAEAAEFERWNVPGSAKLALNFATRADGDAASSLSTETRIYCVDGGARRRFAPYWYLIRPVSGLIRRRTLHAIAREAIASRP
jgi:hypothetical protein